MPIQNADVEEHTANGEQLLLQQLARLRAPMELIGLIAARLLLDQERCTCERCRNHYMTQQEMAAIVGTAREMVGRALHEFQAAGIIELHNGHVVVRDPDRLRMVARERVNTRSRTRRNPAATTEHGEHAQSHQPRTTARTARRAAIPDTRRHADR